jgi:hypothetical protein
MSRHGVPIRELYSECGVRKRVNDTTFHLNGILFRHALSSMKPAQPRKARELCIKVLSIAMNNLRARVAQIELAHAQTNEGDSGSNVPGALQRCADGSLEAWQASN